MRRPAVERIGEQRTVTYCMNGFMMGAAVRKRLDSEGSEAGNLLPNELIESV